MNAPEQLGASTRVMWVAPNFNAYKVRTLNLLAAAEGIDLVVFAGRRESSAGHLYGDVQQAMPVERCSVKKKKFGRSLPVMIKLLYAIRRQRSRVVVMPIEKKLLGLILGLIAIRPLLRFSLVSYNHPCLRSSGRVATRLDLLLTRFLFQAYDRVVFYSEGGMKQAINQGWVLPEKADYANNTLANREIDTLVADPLPAQPPFRLLFVGRLIPEKQFDRMFKLFRALAERIPDIELHMIGDGPDRAVVQQAAEEVTNIFWHGALVDEADLAPYFNKAHVVFHPGSSGLIIAHAFAYGKPFITLRGAQFWHGPEIDYVVDNQNGLILEGTDTGADVARMVALLNDGAEYRSFCRVARQTWASISVDRWVVRMTGALQLLDNNRGATNG